VVIPGEEGAFLASQPVSFLPLNSRTLERLDLLGLDTLLKLRQISPAELRRQFGRVGEEMANLSRGVDPSPLVPFQRDPLFSKRAFFEFPVTGAFQSDPGRWF